jgi:hypothetical protein
MKYLIDSDVILKTHYYTPKRIESFWECFRARFSTGELILIEPVFIEIRSNGKGEKDFVESIKDEGLVVDVFESKAHLYALKEIINKFKKTIKGGFKDIADPHLVAAARVGGYGVISYEKPSSEETLSAKIPDMCKEYSVKHFDLEGYLKEEELRF